MRKLHFRKIKRWWKSWRNPFYKLQYRDQEFPMIEGFSSCVEDGCSATHITAFSYGNAGDVLLPIALRKLFEDILGIKQWHNAHVYNVVDRIDTLLMNRDDCIVIGGGGLFLKDTNPNNLSGWQWSCDVRHLQQIKKPIIMFAVGYNRFRGQEDFDPIFTVHINAFVKNAAFVGLRNHGSIEKLQGYLETRELKEKLYFQPCMTTLISKLYPDYVNYEDKEDFIAINCAYDREEKRAGNSNQYGKIAKVAKQLSLFSKLKIYIHVYTDRNILEEMDKMGVPYELLELSTAEGIISAYAKPRLVIGMRGHAQMIPFGCHTPILSIISHDKMQWFLDDIHHPEWGVELDDEDFERKLFSKAKDIYDNYQNVMHSIEKEQEYLWNITMQNMKTIKSILDNK